MPSLAVIAVSRLRFQFKPSIALAPATDSHVMGQGKRRRDLPPASSMGLKLRLGNIKLGTQQVNGHTQRKHCLIRSLGTHPPHRAAVHLQNKTAQKSVAVTFAQTCRGTALHPSTSRPEHFWTSSGEPTGNG